MAQTILVVDDDASIRDAVSFYMRREGYDVLQAKDGQAAMEVIATENFDLAILDIMMEGYNGFELCSAIRDRNQTVPIILLSAKRDLIDKSLGFKLGADDYITKPFEPAELVMRVNSCLRRSQAFAEKSEGANGDGGSTIILGDLSIDTQTRQVTARGERLELTAKEFDILRLLMENPRRVYTKAQIYSLIWNDAYMGDENAVNVHISRLRTKIEDDPRKPQVVITVWGIGYKLGEQK